MKNLANEFKAFIMRGNVVDLAIAVAIGAAFTAIVNSVVNDLIMPLVGLILGGIDFSGLSFAVGDAVFTYGNFIQAVITFLSVALVLFFVVKGMNSLMRKEAAKPTVPPAPTRDQELLTEIRDLMAAQAGVRPAVTLPPSPPAA